MIPLRIGTRASALALWQAHHIKERLAQLHGVEAELVRIRTSGDHFQTASVAQIGAGMGTKGVFIKELEDALLAGEVDLAVHSMKDVPTETPAGLAFPALTSREDPRDCLISRNGQTLKQLPLGARVGTGSLRRQAQLRHHRADLQVLDLRGNVDTRLRKVAAGEFDAIILAAAGVTRLGVLDRASEIIPAEIMLPAVGQGALGIETREDDEETTKLVAALNDSETHACVTAERALLRELEGGCQVPLGAWARLEKGVLRLEACLLSPGGKECLRGESIGEAEDAEEIGNRLGKILRDDGAERILRLAGRPVGGKAVG
ncbi:MAG: hydroxymethylbilane synthase [Candidatus Acidiferrales bacterium]